MEWRIIEGLPSEVQMKLNQWKHGYHIFIYGYCALESVGVSILLTREKKEESE
jgi:hypothetical protein